MRLKALKEYQILDTMPEQLYDDITKLASTICDTPISLISLIDDHRQWFKSHHGLDVTETPKNLAYCAHAINEPDQLMEIPDAFEDKRFHDNPLAVGEPYVRFYAGTPLVDDNGYPLGTLCVIDHKPRHLTEAQKDALKALGRQVIALLNLRVENARTDNAYHDFLSMVENLGDGVFELDEFGKCTYANASMLKTLNRTSEEVTNTSIWEMIFHEDVAAMKSYYADQFRKKSTKCYYEYRMAPKGKEPVWLAQTTTMKYEGDRMVRLRSIARNLSETKQLQNELEEKDKLFKLVSENSSDLIALHEKSGLYKFVAPSCKELVGYSPHELVGKDPYDFIHPDDVQFLQVVQREKTMEGEGTSNLSFRFRKKNGQYIWMESYIKPILNDDGELVAYQTSARDITEKKKSFARNLKYRDGLKLLNELSALQGTEKLIQKALGRAVKHLGVTEGIIATNETGSCLIQYHYHIDKSKALTTLPLNADSPMVIEIQNSNKVYKVLEPFDHPLSDGEISRFMGCRILKNGEPIGVLALLDQESEEDFSVQEESFVQLFANWLGITLERMEERQQLILAKERAEEANASKSEFLSMMSHEIRTPLNGIIGTTHLISKKNPKPELIPYLNILKQSSDNLLAIVNDILDFNKIQEGKVKLENIDFNLENLVSSIHHNYLVQAQEKHINFYFNFDHKLSGVFVGDSVRLSQILHNLISNAIKFTEKGYVKLDVTCAKELDQYCEISFCVEDTGIGIPKNRQAQIFERFTQASNSISRKFGGSGLGLTIIKNILELMDSDIQIQSNPGEGSRFYFNLVLKRSDKQEAEELIVSDTEEVLEGTVLIVEDNDFNRVIAKDFLTGWGCETLEAANGEECLKVLEKDPDVDLILMDLQMPILDGFSTSYIIRKSKKLKNIPIIALSAEVIGNIKEKVYEVGMNDFITKPFHPVDFFSKIQKHLKDLSSTGSNNDIASQVLKKLEQTVGEESDMVSRYYDIFITSTEEENENLIQLIRKQDMPGIKAYAHKVKSSFLLAGLKELAEEAGDIERLIEEGSPAEMVLEQTKKHEKNVINTLNLLKEYHE